MRHLMRIPLATLLVAGLFPPAWSQVQQIQQGNVLDANPQLGSAGLNSGARRYSVNAGNRIVSGNVTGGASFRGFSPIRDPNSLFIAVPRGSGLGLGSQTGLPSDQLSHFQRDAFSVADLQRGRTGATAPLPYYSLQGTVANTGAIVAGMNRSGSSQMQSPYALPRPDWGTRRAQSPLDETPAAGSLLKVPSQIARIDTGQLIKGPVNERLLNSPLFGAVRMVPANVLADQAENEQALGANVAGPLDQRVDKLEPLDLRVGSNGQGPAGSARNPMERVLGPRTQGPDQTNKPGLPDLRVGGPVAPKANDENGSTLVKPMGPSNERKTQRGPGAVEMHDVFTSMRMASGSLLKPLERTATLGRETKVDREKQGPTPSLVRPLKSAVPAPTDIPPTAAPAGVTVEQRIETAKKVSKESLKTFVGTEESAINKYLAEAEQLLRKGQYYKAANQYDLARAMDGNNPLPLLGRAMSLLAAGEYMSSATNLFQAIRLFESLANFPVDLAAFIPDMTALDRRRADLERRLESYDDFRLRFLLGYAEYNSGLHKLGLTNMKRAAESVPLEWVSVRNFVQLLEQRQLIAPTSQPESGH